MIAALQLGETESCMERICFFFSPFSCQTDEEILHFSGILTSQWRRLRGFVLHVVAVVVAGCVCGEII